MEEQKTTPYDVGVSFSKIEEAVRDHIGPALDVLTRVITKACEVALWNRKNRPHLVHLSLHAKTARRRKKNQKRLCEEYRKEVVRNGQE